VLDKIATTLAGCGASNLASWDLRLTSLKAVAALLENFDFTNCTLPVRKSDGYSLADSCSSEARRRPRGATLPRSLDETRLMMGWVTCRHAVSSCDALLHTLEKWKCCDGKLKSTLLCTSDDAHSAPSKSSSSLPAQIEQLFRITGVPTGPGTRPNRGVGGSRGGG
jgi:hypothetical protein